MTYRRIAALTSAPAAMHDELQEELIDRYGPLPPELLNLFKIVSLKADLASLRINKLERGKDSLVYSFMADTPLRPELLLTYLQQQPKKRRTQAKLTPDGRLVITGQPSTGDDLFASIGSTIGELRRMSVDAV
jgi:transcription-repair coupling factor (superfamily II helicase)